MKTLKRLMIYAFTVGFLPLFVYYTIFQFHMGLVPSSGDHDLLLSPEFKYALEGNNFEPTQPSKLVLLCILICCTNFVFLFFL